MQSRGIILDLSITGDLRSVANSAWISTLDETRANSRSDEDVDRVTSFLAENFHTSPFECVTLTFVWGGALHDRLYMRPYVDSRFTRVDFPDGMTKLTIDLWNFVKITGTEFIPPMVGSIDLREGPAWTLFKRRHPHLASKCEKFDFSGQKLDKSDDVSDVLGTHSMNVELVSLHKEKERNHSRATWRVKCPLSIAVQMLRHRTGSFNMVSARYRTIDQEMIGKFDDISEVYRKIYKERLNDNICAAVLYDKYQQSTDATIEEYKRLMSDAKLAVRSGTISGDDYKRIRETARYVLPEGRLTELYVTFYLDDFDNYLYLRDSPHTQTEHVWVAQRMLDTLSDALDNSND
jgi:flavin-dependent thymidylate synthase